MASCLLSATFQIQRICWHQPSTTILWQGTATTVKTLRADGTVTSMQSTQNHAESITSRHRHATAEDMSHVSRAKYDSAPFRHASGTFISISFFHRMWFSLNVGKLPQHHLPRHQQTEQWRISCPYQILATKEKCLQPVTWRGLTASC